MKKAPLLLMLLMVFASYGHAANDKSKDLKFKIDARVDGLLPGDTLIFSTTTLPQWHKTIFDTMIVSKPDRFTYSGRHPHIKVIFVERIPGPATIKEGKDLSSDASSAMVLAERGTTVWEGTALDFGYPTLRSELYADSTVQTYTHLSDSIGRVRSSYLRLMADASNRKDTAEANRCIGLFNSMYNTPESKRLGALRRAMKQSDTQYALYSILSDAMSTDPGELQSRYDKFSDATKASYLGGELAKFIDVISRIAVGRSAPEISFTSMDGTPRKLSDYRGRYMLMYFGGMCPGSFAIQSHVIRMDSTYKSKGLDVVLFTENYDQLCQLRDQVDAESTLYGVNIKEATTSLASQTLTTVDISDGSNPEVKATYYPAGLPFFVFISPDGTILARGFSEAYNEADAILERELK